jgi:hypothetical protein
VHHEARRIAGVALGPGQEHGDGDRGHGAGVVGDQLDGQLAQVVIQADAVADVAAVRLQQDVRGGDAVFRHVGHRIEDASHHVAVDVARKREIGMAIRHLSIVVHGIHSEVRVDEF